MTEKRSEDKESVEWAKAIKARDNYCCVVCGRFYGELNSHHLFSYADHEDLRYDLNNGVTLCRICHDSFHLIYGRGGNTREQFDEWVRSRRIIVKALKGQL